jgi:PRTRC genetic system protein E
MERLHILIMPSEGQFLVSILPKYTDVDDKAITMVKPVNLLGSPEDLDESLATSILAPLAKVQGFHDNIAEFEKSLEKAKANSEMAKKEKDEKKKAAERDAKKRDENDKKVREAIIDAETSAKEQPEAALKSLEDLKGRNLTLSDSVSQSLTVAIEKLKTEQKQFNLFA